MQLRGRHWLVVWLAGFLVVAGSVALRQQAALGTARALDDARTRRASLESQRAELERAVREASSREALAPRAARQLGLRFAADSEIVMLRVPLPDGR
jgi:hypothetical protein